jgi:hypothetical protein
MRVRRARVILVCAAIFLAGLAQFFLGAGEITEQIGYQSVSQGVTYSCGSVWGHRTHHLVHLIDPNAAPLERLKLARCDARRHAKAQMGGSLMVGGLLLGMLGLFLFRDADSRMTRRLRRWPARLPRQKG